MAFFPQQYKVFADADNNRIILSSRISEDVAESYILTRQACTPFVDATDFSSWAGSEEIKGKIANNEATLALKTSEGTKYYRTDTGTMLVMQAQMKSLLPQIKEDVSSVVSDDSDSDSEELLHRDTIRIQHIIRQELALFKRELLADLAGYSKVLPQPKIEAKTTILQPSNVFIPSQIKNNDLKGEIKVKTKQNSSTIDGALEALNKLRKQGDK